MFAWRSSPSVPVTRKQLALENPPTKASAEGGRDEVSPYVPATISLRGQGKAA